MLLLLLAGTASADEAVKPVSEEPLWLRVEIGSKARRILTCFLDESKGTGKGYDRAVVDLDGDGTPETVQKGELSIDYGDGRVEEFEVPEIRVTHEGRKWTLEFFEIAEERPKLTAGIARCGFDWTVEGEDAIAVFIFGRLTLHAGLEQARKADPVRLGPPFEWVVTPKERGPHPMLSVAVRDATGLTLRVAGRGEEEARPRVRVSNDEGVDLTLDGEYG
jgi:hypothetical protein